MIQNPHFDSASPERWGAAHVAVPKDGHAASTLALLDEAIPGVGHS